MARPGFQDITGRYQFRLDLRDPRQYEFALKLEAMPKGQRNRAIVDKLIDPAAPASAEGIKQALREVLLECGEAFQRPPCPSKAEEDIPLELFDTSQFS